MEFGIPRSRIFQVAAIHFVLVINAMMNYKTATAYEFYNIIFFISLFWSLHSKESLEAVNTAYAINFASIFFDIAVVFFYSINEWSQAFVILNMLFRVYSLKQIYEEIIARGGDDDTETAALV